MKQPWYMRLAVHATLVVLAIPFAMPLVWMIGTSLKTDAQVFPKEVTTTLSQFLSQWWPNPFRGANYPEADRKSVV